MVVCDGVARADRWVVIAGFFTGGALAIRGGYKAARNSAIGCACLLAVIEGVGIGFQRMMAENTRLEVWPPSSPLRLSLISSQGTTTSSPPTIRNRRYWLPSTCSLNDYSETETFRHPSQMAPITLLFCPRSREAGTVVFSFGLCPASLIMLHSRVVYM
jgi:hypothetical protein